MNHEDIMVDEVMAEDIDPDSTDLDKSLPTILDSEADLGEETVVNEHDPEENLPPGEAENDPPMTPEEMEKLYDQLEMKHDVTTNLIGSWITNSKMVC